MDHTWTKPMDRREASLDARLGGDPESIVQQRMRCNGFRVWSFGPSRNDEAGNYRFAVSSRSVAVHEISNV